MYTHSKNQKDMSHPSVRSACEPCRARKMRCIIPSEGGSCNDCRSRKISCYFLPRYKSGRRPLRTDNEESRSCSCTPSKTSDECAAANGRSQHHSATKSAGGSIAYSSNHGESSADSARVLSLATPPGGTSTLSDYNITPEFESQDPPFAPPMQSSTSHDFQGIQPSREGFFAPVLEGISHNAFDAFPSPIDIDDYCRREDTKGRFATLMDHFCRLRVHLHERSTPQDSSRPVPAIQRQHMLTDVDNSCNFLFSIYGSASQAALDTHSWDEEAYALASLANALIVVIMRVADALLGCEAFRKTEIGDVLALKRLDYNITQAKLVAMQIQQATLDGTLLSQSIRLSTGNVETKLKSLG